MNAGVLVTGQFCAVLFGYLNTETMLAITGATGHLGQATLNALLQRVAPTNLVAIARDPKKAANLSELGVQVR